MSKKIIDLLEKAKDPIKGGGNYIDQALTLLNGMLSRLDRTEAELKAKDEIIFAYESVHAPINPLLAINKDLLEVLEEASADFYYIHQHPEDAHTDSYNFMEKANAAISKAKKEG